MTRVSSSHRIASFVVACVALLAAAGCSDSSSSEAAASTASSAASSTTSSIDPAASTTSAPTVDESTVPPTSSTPTTEAVSPSTTASASPPTTAACRRLDALETGPLGWEWPDGLVVGVGDCGPLVELIQSMLVNRGYSIAVDGQYGPRTAAAVRDAQPTVSLPATGSVDEETFFRIWNSNVDNVDPGA